MSLLACSREGELLSDERAECRVALGERAVRGYSRLELGEARALEGEQLLRIAELGVRAQREGLSAVRGVVATVVMVGHGGEEGTSFGEYGWWW